jgi:hypothetical protein
MMLDELLVSCIVAGPARRRHTITRHNELNDTDQRRDRSCIRPTTTKEENLAGRRGAIKRYGPGGRRWR